MKETYEYILSDVDNKSYNIKCKAEYNTENDYDTTYYFFDGDTWHKEISKEQYKLNIIANKL